MKESGISVGELRLQELAQIACDAGAEHLAGEAQVLAQRVLEGLFYVACVGQFKRGKSSLINALIGDAVLPVGVAPITTVVTVIRYGEKRGARIRFAKGDWQVIEPEQLTSFVSEEHNPENSKGVTAVEVFTPSKLLSSGMCLVDTPGIGSVFSGNTEATRTFVPHIDAGIVVLGGDPPISGDELSLVEEASKYCQDFLFVLNKVDRLSDAECKTAADFSLKVLSKRLGKMSRPLFALSAAERLAGSGIERDWAAFVGALDTLAKESGSDLVRSAEERGSSLITERLSRFLDENRDALLRPVAESEKRVTSLRSCVAAAQQSLNDLGFLFTAEQERLGRIFREKRDEFLKRALAAARWEFSDELGRLKLRGTALRDKAVDIACRICQRWLGKWHDEAEPAAETLYVGATRRFIDLANEFLVKLANSGNDAIANLPTLVEPEKGFRVKSRLFYVTLMSLTGRTPFGWLIDLIGPRSLRMRRTERDIGEYLEYVLTINANRIANDLDDRVIESRRRLESEIHTHLSGVSSAAEIALNRAKERQAQGQAAVENELARIEALRKRLHHLSPSVSPAS
jgi:GTP-binding protein EngB required for normal cell division